MPRKRPYDDGNLQDLDSKLVDRTVAVLETDVLKQIIDTSVAGTMYVCKAPTDSADSIPSWQIMRSITAAGIQTITWASGNGKFEHIAADRLTLEYK